MIDGFLLKKLVSMFLHVIPGALFVLLASQILRRWWPRFCNLLSLTICCGLIAGSISPVSNYFIVKLESQFPVLQIAPADTAVILVLGSGHNYVQDRPANSILTATALSRLTEGIRLWKSQPASFLLLSGASSQGPISHAIAMRNMAVELGVPAERILLLEHTRDTEEEVAEAHRMIKTFKKGDNTGHDSSRQRLVVASSATHLPRAALMLDDTSVLYSMAPTDYAFDDAPWYRPHAGSLKNLDRALHEWVGMSWYRLRNSLSR